MSKKIELVAPGGSLKKIEYAYHYGADAVYVGHPNFSLRARLNNFSETNLKKALMLARKIDKKIYFTLNIYAHERHLPKIKKHLAFIKMIKPDAVIVSDPGILNLLKKYAPKTKIHLSTQANTTNSEAVKFWRSQGVSRIVLAREVTLPEIKKIRKACPKMELEYFVHGAMYMSMSGRCLLSRWMRDRSANLGDCIQPCRWPYRPAELEFPISPLRQISSEASNFQFPNKSKIQNSNDQDKTNSGEKKVIIEEDQNGSYIFNSKDLCLIEHLDKLANRGYTAGFLFGKDKWENNTKCSHRENNYQFVGEIIGESKDGWQKIKAHNALKAGEKVEIISPQSIFLSRVKEIKNEKGELVGCVHGGSKNIHFIRLLGEFPPKSLLRKKIA